MAITYTSDAASSTSVDYSNAASGAIATGAAAAATGDGASDGASGSGSGSNSGNGDGNGNDSGSSDPILTPQQTQMVGGIVGGLAGIALVLVIVLYLLRRYRQRLKHLGRLPEQLASGHSRGDSGLVGAAGPMSQSRSSLFFPPAVVASNMKKWRPASEMTMMTNTTSTTAADSEKGFHRVSGRRIPSVLSTGGDQFGGSYGAFEKEIRSPSAHNRPYHDLSKSSFYRDADGIYVGSGNGHVLGRSASRSAPTTPVYPAFFSSESARRPSLANMTVTDRRDFGNSDISRAFYRNTNMNVAAPNPNSKPDGMAVFRSSPARTPVTQSPVSGNLRLPIQAPVTMDEDIPEMPLPSPGFGLGIGASHHHNLPQPRTPVGSGRFKEELA